MSHRRQVFSLQGLIWRPIMKKGASRAKIIIASILGCVLTLQLGAFSVTLETLISGITELPFSAFVATMQPIHLAIGFVEGLITSAVLIFVYEARPELLWGIGESTDKKEARLSLKKTVAVIAIAAAICGGFVSLYASAFPDGLEWSMEQVAGTTELEAQGTVYEKAENIQETTSLLPDYAFPDSEAAAGTSFSGIVGALIVAGLSAACCYAFRFFRRKIETQTA